MEGGEGEGQLGPSPNPDYNDDNGIPIHRRGESVLSLCIWRGRVQEIRMRRRRKRG